jgi:hypothetical protein
MTSTCSVIANGEHVSGCSAWVNSTLVGMITSYAYGSPDAPTLTDYPTRSTTYYNDYWDNTGDYTYFDES